MVDNLGSLTWVLKIITMNVECTESGAVLCMIKVLCHVLSKTIKFYRFIPLTVGVSRPEPKFKIIIQLTAI